MKKFLHLTQCIAQSARAVEYTECTPAEVKCLPLQVSWIRHLIWWWGSSDAGDWGMLSTPWLPSLLGSLGQGEVAPYRTLSMAQIELKCVLLLCWIVWNWTDSLYEKLNLALNNLQRFIYHETLPTNQPINQNPRDFCFSFSKTDSGLCIYHLSAWSNFNFKHYSQGITLPIKSCTFSANLPHWLITWLIVSSIIT